jgi:hypothetical protein
MAHATWRRLCTLTTRHQSFTFLRDSKLTESSPPQRTSENGKAALTVWDADAFLPHRYFAASSYILACSTLFLYLLLILFFFFLFLFRSLKTIIKDALSVRVHVAPKARRHGYRGSSRKELYCVFLLLLLFAIL